jgi:hypothetical protein
MVDIRSAKMILRKSACLLFTALLIGVLSGCKDKEEGEMVLPTINQYFPDSSIYKFDKRVLWIQTHVDGISGKVAASIYAQACQTAAKSIGKIRINIAEELEFDGRSILVIGFKNGCVACDLRDGIDANGVPRGTIMGWQQSRPWFIQHLGYMPTPDIIRVEKLADIQNTPKGQPMHLETLAQEQAELREKQLEIIREIQLKQKVEDEQEREGMDSAPRDVPFSN